MSNWWTPLHLTVVLNSNLQIGCSLSVIACLDGGRVDVPTMTQILQGRMKDQTTSHDELRDAFQVCQMCLLYFYIILFSSRLCRMSHFSHIFNDQNLYPTFGGEAEIHAIGKITNK